MVVTDWCVFVCVCAAVCSLLSPVQEITNAYYRGEKNTGGALEMNK